VNIGRIATINSARITEVKQNAAISPARLIPLSQVNQNLGLAGQIRNVCAHAGRCPSALRPAPDCGHAFAGIVAPDDIPVTRRVMVRGDRALATQCPSRSRQIASAAHAPSYYILTNLGQRDEPRPSRLPVF
jgi:hypothetical protein